MFQSFSEWMRRPGGRAINFGDPDTIFRKSVSADRATRFQRLMAELEQARAQGQTHKIWLASADEKTRPAHRAAHGQVQPIDAPFIVDGESLFLPCDPNASFGETANCRCSVR